jgi:hypothetical protein
MDIAPRNLDVDVEFNTSRNYVITLQNFTPTSESTRIPSTTTNQQCVPMRAVNRALG